MMLKENDIFTLVARIGDHYRSNINNRHIRKAILAMRLDKTTWEHIDDLTEKQDMYKFQGYQFDELYDQILAMGRFVSHARREMLPNMRVLLSGSSDAGLSKRSFGSENEKVLRDMAINNFRANLGVLGDLVNELYMKTVEFDKKLNPHRPVYMTIPELKELGSYLV